jgi:outer membrane protein assembly factor BamB
MSKRSLWIIAAGLIAVILVSVFTVYEFGLVNSNIPSGNSSVALGTFAGAAWQSSLENSSAGLAVDDGRVFVIEFLQQGYVYWPYPGGFYSVHCFDSQTGKQLWENTNFTDLYPYTLTASGGGVYFSYPQGTVCLNATTGKLVWIAAGQGGMVIKDGTVYSQMNGYNATTGALLWQTAYPYIKGSTDNSWQNGWSRGYPLDGDPIDGKYIYCIGGDYSRMTFFKLDTTNGAVLWQSSASWDGTLLSFGLDAGLYLPKVLGVTDGQVIIQKTDNLLSRTPSSVIISIDANTGKQLWSISVNAQSQADAIYSPAIYNNLLLLVASDGNLYAINLSDGSVAWKNNVDPDKLLSVNNLFDNSLQTASIQIDTQNQRLFWSLAGSHNATAANSTGTICSLNITDGSINWIKPLNDEDNNFGGTIALAFNSAQNKLFQTENKGLWIFNASTGDLVENQLFNSTVVAQSGISNQTFVATGLKLYGFR